MDTRKTETRYFIKTATIMAAWILLSYMIATVFGTKGGGRTGRFWLCRAVAHGGVVFYGAVFILCPISP